MVRFEQMVKKTLAYSSYFGYFLSPDEVHRWLISSKLVSRDKILSYCNREYLSQTFSKNKSLSQTYSQQKTLQAQKMAKLLSLIPTIQLVAVTGSVAVNNAKKNDDIDLMIITSNYSLWITRPLVLLLLVLFSKRRLPRQTYLHAANSFCPNLWLETRSLEVPKSKQNLYTAHEVLYTAPVFDRGSVHNEFLIQNSWVQKFLANAYHLSTNAHNFSHVRSNFTLSILLYPINLILFFIQYLYMKPKLTDEDVKIDHAYFHTINFNHKIQKHFDSVLS